MMYRLLRFKDRRYSPIYDQWLAECLELTDGWRDEFMKFNYTVRADDYTTSPISDMWAQPDDEPPIEAIPEQSDESQPAEDEIPMEEPRVDEDSTTSPELDEATAPSPEPKVEKDDVQPIDRKDTVDKNDEENKSDDYADPLEAAIITIISILISILFGGTGGYVPTLLPEIMGSLGHQLLIKI